MFLFDFKYDDLTKIAYNNQKVQELLFGFALYVCAFDLLKLKIANHKKQQAYTIVPAGLKDERTCFYYRL